MALIRLVRKSRTILPMSKALQSLGFSGLSPASLKVRRTRWCWSGPRPGGAITAALFLKQFVKNTPWAHLDVAGPVWIEKENGYNNPGATGYGVRTLVNWVLS